MTARELREAQARYMRATARAETARHARDEAIRAAVAAGWTHARVAAELPELTRSRVGQIALGKR